MRATLLKSVINFTLFWWIVGFVTFSVADPSVNAEVLRRLADMLDPYIIIEVPERVSVVHAIGMQMEILRYWSIPVAVAVTALFTAGYLLSWLVAVAASQQRKSREKGKGSWRGMGVTLGEFPMPVAPSRTPIKLKCSGVVATGLSQMPEAARQLTQEILELLAAHPKAYVGAGHGGITLLEHTLNVMRRGFDVEDPDPLLPVVLAGHDMGKVTAFIQRGDDWLPVKPHDKESARLLAMLPGYWALSAEDRKLVIQAIRYSHSIWNAPHDGVDMERLKRLVKQMKAADGEATAEEKQSVLEKLPLPEVAFRAFLSILPELPFQEPGLPRKVPAAGWRVDNRVYLLESRVRDSAIAKLDKHTAAALGGTHREQAKVAKYTANLLMAFDEAGWLVKKIGKARTPVDEALWRIKAGTCTFQGVIVLDLPDDKLSLLPKHNTAYEINVISQQFPPSGSISSANLSMAGLLSGGQPGQEAPAGKAQPEAKAKPTEAVPTPAPATETRASRPEPKPVKPRPAGAGAAPEVAPPVPPKTSVKEPVDPRPVQIPKPEEFELTPPTPETSGKPPASKRKERRIPTAPAVTSDKTAATPNPPAATPAPAAAPATPNPSPKPAPTTPKASAQPKPKKSGLLPAGLLK